MLSFPPVPDVVFSNEISVNVDVAVNVRLLAVKLEVLIKGACDAISVLLIASMTSVSIVALELVRLVPRWAAT